MSLFDLIFRKKPAPTPHAGQTASPATTTPVNRGRVLLIHGYSATGEDLLPWKNALAQANIATHTIAVGNYITLNNEVSLKDLGEAFDRALRLTEWSSRTKDDTWTFDAIVHSTGMLVLRQWLVSDPFTRDDPRSRIRRLKHLVGLAPATFGSPQAKQGRSWLGALVKGNKHLGPDFMNAGDQVLDGLELASSYTWWLAHQDMLCPRPLYDKGSATPYVAVFIGNEAYAGVDALANSPGTDGTVRWAGCALNTRKVSLDFRREPKLRDDRGEPTRIAISSWVSSRLGAPVIAVPGQNHGSIVEQPHPTVVSLINGFLNLASDAAYSAWETQAQLFGQPALKEMDRASSQDGFGGAGWQQLLVRMIDDHGDPVTDYNLKLFLGDALTDSYDPEFPSIPLIADTYSRDASYRCFYVRLSPTMLALNAKGMKPQKLWLELIATTGTDKLEYEAYTDLTSVPRPLSIRKRDDRPVQLDLTPLAQGQDKLLFPYTTTLLEICVEREPLPLNEVSEIFKFLPGS